MKSLILLLTGAVLCTFPFQMYPEQLLSRINEVRRQNGAPQLALASELSRSAQEHADYQLSMSQVIRTGPNSPLQRALKAGFKALTAAAAVTKTIDTSYQRAIEQMLDRALDPMNYEALISKQYTHAGFGAAVQGGAVYWAVHLAEQPPPQPPAPAPAPVPTVSAPVPTTPPVKPSVIPVVHADAPPSKPAVPEAPPAPPCCCCEMKEPQVILAVLKPKPVIAPVEGNTLVISASPNLLAPKRIVPAANPIFADNPTNPMLPRQEFAYPAGYPSVPAPRPIGYDTKGQPIFIQ